MTERFAVPDELTCYYDRPAEPANVHVEIRVAGQLDESVLRACVQAVLAAEPRIRARRLPTSRWRRSYYWEFPPVPDADPVRVTAYADQADLDRQRDAFLSQSPSLDTSPPLRFLLASGPGGASLILNAHHACFDGLSCLRLLRSVAQEYSVAAERALAARAVPVTGPRPAAGLPVARPAARRSRRGSETGGLRRRRGGAITRIARGQGLGRGSSLPGYGVYPLTWDGLAVADSLRSAGASVNDLLIAALMLAISEWNESRGTGRGQIRITMPVGDPAQGSRDGQWANLSRLTAVTARVAAAAAAGELLGEVARQTRYAKDHPGPQVDLVSRALAAAPVPVAVKHLLLRTALRVAGPLFCDTSLVSNLGVIEAPAFGAASAADVWFSTSAHMPRGLSLGAVTVGGRLRLTFRYRRCLFRPADAAEFAGRYVKVLDQFAGREAAPR
ncbi:MAG TPA: hypothetical protein VMU94_10015 [Streptosporangiaceae bacterium]|nr:hypothetical protein [Streptosporangiaceae bacterium]